MNVLDENIPKDQRQLLERWRIRVRQIGVNVGRRGLQDDEIIPLLLTLRRPTFFTRDVDFYDRGLRHPRYGLIFLDVEKYEAAAFIRRLLAHPEFDTQIKRMGIVVRISSAGITCWRWKTINEIRIKWE